MDSNILSEKVVTLDMNTNIWDQFFTIAPLVVIGTKEDKHYNLAPKHMATPLGFQNYFGFVCTPKHSTYHNVKFEKSFTVSFPKPDQVVLSSLASLPRCEEGGWEKEVLEHIPISWGSKVNAPMLKDSYLYFECELDRVIDGFGEHSLISGKIVAAHLDENYLRSSEKDEQFMIYNNPMLAFLAHGRFAAIKDSYNFPYTKGFKK
ncbi:MAG: flavin reductase [Saprospiraceae bacterium]|nr:flavin reductase [Saprospiraceae bacterium]